MFPVSIADGSKKLLRSVRIIHKDFLRWCAKWCEKTSAEIFWLCVDWEWRSWRQSPDVYLELSQTSKIDLSVKIVLWLPAVSYFRKKLHLRCLNGFWMCGHNLMQWGSKTGRERNTFCRSHVFYQKAILKNSAKFTQKQ